MFLLSNGYMIYSWKVTNRGRSSEGFKISVAGFREWPTLIIDVHYLISHSICLLIISSCKDYVLVSVKKYMLGGCILTNGHAEMREVLQHVIFGKLC